MRGDPQQRLALAHVAPHQAEVEELQVAKATVDEPCRPGARARGEVVLFDERHREAAEGGVAGDAGPDDPPADDEEIDGAVAERPHRLLACSYLFALLYLSIWSFMSAAAASSAAWLVA